MPTIADTGTPSAQLVFNPAAGGAVAIREGLTRAARGHGILVRVVERGQDARQAAQAAVEEGARTLAVAGGDGSVAAVAGVATEHDLPLVIVPVGTLNHFARDLGLDLTRPLDALDAIASTHERSVDIGRINGRPFINNPCEFAQWNRLGQRRHMDLGMLQVSVLDVSTRDELERLIAGTLRGSIEVRPALRRW